MKRRRFLINLETEWRQRERKKERKKERHRRGKSFPAVHCKQQQQQCCDLNLQTPKPWAKDNKKNEMK